MDGNWSDPYFDGFFCICGDRMSIPCTRCMETMTRDDYRAELRRINGNGALPVLATLADEETLTKVKARLYDRTARWVADPHHADVYALQDRDSGETLIIVWTEDRDFEASVNF